MTGPLLYPPADHTSQWVGKGSVTMPMNHVKWVVHTTETAGGWPSYTAYDSQGNPIRMGSAPTLTYEPWAHKWRQHFYLNQSARALRNDGDHYTNRVDVIQTEISCYCDHALSGKYGHAASQIDDQAVNDLGEFGAWLMREWGMAGVFYPQDLPWPTYPKGCPRMSWDKYVSFSGVLGHMAVPGNTHLDPGDLPMDRIAARMGGASDPWPHWRDTSSAVGAMVEKLAASGYFNGPKRDDDNYYGAATKQAIANLQRAFDDTKADPDGIIGELTWKHILALPDAPKEPPVHRNPLAEAWQKSAGDTSQAFDKDIADGEAFVKAHPNMKAYATILTQKKAAKEQAAAHWAAIKDAATR